MEIRGKKIVSNILSAIVKKKTGCSTDILLNNVDVSKYGDKRKIHISLDVEADKEDVKKIIKNLNGNKKSKK